MKPIEPHETLYEEEHYRCSPYPDLPRECPKCGTVAHYKIKKKERQEPHLVECSMCGYKFIIKWHKKGERPKAKTGATGNGGR